MLAEVGPILDRAAAPSTPAPKPAPPRSPGPPARPAASTSAGPPTPSPPSPHIFADNGRHSSPWAAKLYADARARGKRHPHAIRILARAWLRVIWACWHTNTAYDPARHRAEQRLEPTRA